MKKKFSLKLCAAAIAAVCALNLPIIPSVISAEGTKYEFEAGTQVNAKIQEKGSERYMAGASGDSFVFLEKAGETASVSIDAPETGMYSISIRYYAYCDVGESKIQNLYVNGVNQGQMSFMGTGDWADVEFGPIMLNAGKNDVMIESSWGWTNLDYLTVESASLSEVKATDKILCDPKATAKSQSLFNYLNLVYGKNILSGQQEIYNYGHGGNFEVEFDYIKNLTGDLPAIRGFDFLNCANVLYGSEDGTADRMIDWVNNKNGIVTASWHVVVPKNFSSYTLNSPVSYEQSTYKPDETDFDTSKAVVKGTKEYDYYMLCLKSLAEQFKKLQDANVPVIFRPLHEAEGSGGETGSWFWWGKSGSDVYKKLYILTYKTLTEEYGIHNIIWEWNSYSYDTSANWYPGDEYVDIIGYDKYNCTDWSSGSPVFKHNDSAIGSTFYNIMEKYNSKKMVAMAENDNVPTLSNLLGEKAAWLYFCTWYDGENGAEKFLSDPVFNVPDDLKELYQSDYCINLSELPSDLYSTGMGETQPTDEPTTDDPSETTEPATSEDETTETTTDAVESTAATSTDPTETTTAVSNQPTDTSSESTAPTDEPTAPTETTVTGDTEKIPVPSDVTRTKFGDTTCNGIVDVSDVVRLNKALMDPAEAAKLSDLAIVNSDCNKDGWLGIDDSSIIIDLIAMVISESDL